MKPPFLAAAAPDWFEVTRVSANGVEGLARLPRTRWAKAGLALTVRGSRPVVRETVPGAELPTWCLERHIFGEAEFCMGLSTPSIRSHIAAEHWWDQLAQFIVCQSVAAETGLWPLMNGLDHGSAGHLHNRALDLAENLGISDEYLAIQSGYASSFSSETVLRFADDPKFAALQDLEARRRAAKVANDAAAVQSTRKCCGTMRDCPYRAELKVSLTDVRDYRVAGGAQWSALLASSSTLAIAASIVAALKTECGTARGTP